MDSSKDQAISLKALHGRKVVVIDDVPFSRLLPGMVLRPFGVEVFEFSNALDVFPVLKTHPILCILLDIAMPGTDGIEALKLLKSSGLLNTTRVIAYTAYADGEESKRLINLGFDSVLLKPIKSQDLLEILNSSDN